MTTPRKKRTSILDGKQASIFDNLSRLIILNNSTPVAQLDGKVVLYETPDGGVRVDVRLGEETVWLTQIQMAKVFRTLTGNVGLHLKNIFLVNELEESATTEDFSVVQTEGKRRVQRALKYCNLDTIISVGYHINSKQGVLALDSAMGAIVGLKRDLMACLIINLLAEPAR